MKFPGIYIVFIIAAFVLSTDAVINVLNQLSKFNNEVRVYRNEVLSAIESLRIVSEIEYVDYFKRNLKVIQDNIKKVSSSDIEIRDRLESEIQNSCIDNLMNNLNQLVEMSGYQISNCVHNKYIDTDVNIVEITPILQSVEAEINQLGIVAINGLIKRNIFTDYDEIVAYVKNHISTKKIEIDAIFIDIAAKFLKSSEEWELEFANMKVCFDGVNDSIKSGSKVVESQIPICSKFYGQAVST